MPVAVSLLTSDGYLILRRRAQRATFAAGRLESAANGNPEIRGLDGSKCDRTEDGLIDLASAAKRELLEELGPVPLVSPPRAACLIIASNDEEVGSPAVLFEARTSLDARALRERFGEADPVEGYHESSGELVALPITPAAIAQSLDFVLTEADIRPIARAASLIALLGHTLSVGAGDIPRSSDRDAILHIER